MRGAVALLAGALWLAAPVPLLAQTPPAEAPASPVLTLSQDGLFAGSDYGRAVQARFEAVQAALAAENRRIEQGLEAEELDLTRKRATLPPDQFRALADAFDTKVEEIRRAQDAKARDIAKSHDADKQKFFEAAVPVLADLMRDLGAVAIIDKSALVLSFDRIDITAEAILRVNAVLGSGEVPAPEVPADAQPAPVPGADPGAVPDPAPAPQP